MLLTELERFIDEDTGYYDISSGIVPDCQVKGVIISKEKGIIAGLSEATQVFEYFDVYATTDLMDGDPVKKESIIFSLEGGARSILKAERLALNFIGKMSGIATLTRKYVEKAKGVRIACTRKTTPGFRKFEKKAVIAGGGDPHRFNLSDSILIKDNHIAVLGLEKAIEEAKSRKSFTQKVEVEVTDLSSAVLAAGSGVDIIMFDNMQADEIENCLKILDGKGLRKNIIFEASGGISLENIEDYAKTGVNVISVGGITHSSRWHDVSLRIGKL